MGDGRERVTRDADRARAARRAVARQLVQSCSAKWVEFRRVRKRGRRVRARVRSRAIARRGRDAREARDAEPVHARVRSRAVQFLAQTQTRARGVVAIARRGSAARRWRRCVSCSTRRRTRERDRSSRFVPWLATIGSVSPLIGLLGTVLGVIDGVHRHRDEGLRQHSARRAGRCRSADRDGGGARGGHSGGVRVQHLREPR